MHKKPGFYYYYYYYHYYYYHQPIFSQGKKSHTSSKVSQTDMLFPGILVGVQVLLGVGSKRFNWFVFRHSK